MSLSVFPETIAQDANGIVVFRGPANVAVEWSASDGTIVGLSDATNDSGVATAVFTPGLTLGSVVITCTHGDSP